VSVALRCVLQAATESFLQQQAAMASYGSLAGGSMSMSGMPGFAMGLNPAVTNTLYNSNSRSSAGVAGGQGTQQQLAGSSRKQPGTDSSKSRHGNSHALVPTAQQQQRKAAAHTQQPPQQQQLHGVYDPQQPSPAGFFQSYSGAAAMASSPGMNWPQLLSPPVGSFNSKIPQYSAAAPGSVLPAVAAKSAANSKASWQLQRPPALQLQQQQQHSPQGKLASKGSSSSAAPTGSYAQLHQQQHGKGTPGAAESAARRKQQRERDKPKRPDRFAEGAKNAAMITAMASRW
jgi:hypothetical protein